MADSEPTHDNPRNTRNLPAVVPHGEIGRPATESWLLRMVRSLFGWKAGSVRDDLQIVLDASTPDDVGFSAVERTMMRNILDLHERRIADVMVHRADIVAVKRDIPLGELMGLFESAAHSRLVVYNETLDDPEGIVHIRDLLVFMTARARSPDTTKPRRKKPPPAGLDLRAIDLAMPLFETNIIRKLLYVPPSMRAIDLLAQMQASRIHLALVVDEYGGTDGLVSIEDIVEQIVGEIDDEHDSDVPPAIVRQADNSFIADARASLDDVRSVIGEEFVTGEAGEEVATLGGYLVSHVGRLPVRGEVISGPGNFEVEVLDADPRRVKRLRIAIRKERPVARSQRETRRREAPSEAGQPTRQQHHKSARRRRSRVPVSEAVKSFAALGQAIILSWGWKRAGIALAAGALSDLAMAPFNAWPVLFLTFPVMVWLIDGAGGGRLRGVPAAAIAGFWFGLGYFVPGLYWIGYAFLVDAETFAWLLPFAVLGLPAYLALFMALGFALARLMWNPDASRVVVLAASLTVSEWLRGHVLTGFPWNAFGYALSEPLALAQTASLIGLWGMTFLSVAMFASPAVLIDGSAKGRTPWTAPVTALALLLAMGVFGAVRLSQNPTAMVGKIKLRIMQPNLEQDAKFNYAAKAAVMQKYLTLSDRASGPQSTGVRDANILIWPESAFPFFLTREADAMAQIADLLPKGTVLITGSVRAPDLAPGARITRAYNSIYVIDHDGSVTSVYDKLHLVPFGEFLPFQDWMERLGFEQLTRQQGGFIPGSVRRALDIPNAPAALPLICYEAIFPAIGLSPDDRPGWMVNLTNDGWFGISTGPYQHLQQARMRAIEQGLPLVRAANTGISAVVDPLGRIVARLGLGLEGVLDSGLPTPISPTIYARLGDIPAGILVIGAVLIALSRRFARRLS